MTTSRCNRYVWTGLLAFAFGLAATQGQTAVTWPAGQLLPSFSTPAGTQDLITINYPPSHWEAEGSSLSHATGHLDGDGWLCQTGIDAANLYMVYGPYDTTIPPGPNTATYRLKIDNNTADNNPQVTIDVRDNTNGAILAAQTITRQQFTVAGDWVNFNLPFSNPTAGHALEFRVYWMGGSYIKADWIETDRSAARDEAPLFASLKGVVNATQPRIFSYESGGAPTEATDWLSALGLGYTQPADRWTLITKYRSDLQGIVVYDDAQPDTINLATTIAGQRKALVAAPSLVAKLNAAPYSLPTLVDLRGLYTSKLAVYQALFNNYWAAAPHRVIVGLDPRVHKAAAREYAAALGAGVVWLDPRVSAESTLLNSFLSSMGAGTMYTGWWPEEGSGVSAASAYGISTAASDWSWNLTVYGGTSRTINVKGIPAKPPLQNKMYVAFVLSDGDNLQFVEHYEHTLWKDAGRGQVPIGWTLSPVMLDAMPGVLNWYYSTATANDALLSGPSGYGYTYPNLWTNASQLDQFVAKTEDYTKRAGFRAVTIWNTITGGINANVGNSFANNAPSLLGLTAQNTGGGLTIYNGKLPGFAFSCNYCTNEQAMKDFIATAASGWPGNVPRFILIQAQPWQGVTPTSFLNVKNSLNANYVVVRPDNWFQLLRQANNLPIEPIGKVANGTYRVINKNSGKCLDAAGGATANGTIVQQYTCNSSSAQNWTFTATDSGYYKVTTANNAAQGWDITGGTTATGDGVKLELWSYGGGSNQQYQPVWEPGGTYHLIARHADKCLDVNAASTADGVQLQQWTCNNSLAQSFTISTPPAATPTATATPTPTTRATPTFTATACSCGATPTATPTRTSTPTATATAGTSTSVSLTSAFNVNVAYSDGTTFPSTGGIDGVGSAYSSNLLGASMTWSSATFNFGAANVLNGVRNKTVTLPTGQFTTLLLLGTGVNGDQLSQTVRVNYNDGTSSTFTQTFSNWLNASQSVAGQSIAKSMAYRNKSTGVADNRVFNLYGYSFALDHTRVVSNLVLPATNNVSILAATLR
jgi:hypothetical protein